ncbi:MAG: hypothetical protein M3Z26_04880 [Bacteroidota bacterium]|nr:hypothetical protein [Bacteroidota bacterium]
MKHNLLILLLVVATSYLAKSQTHPSKINRKAKTYVAKINPVTSPRNLFLYSIGDTSLQLSTQQVRFSNSSVMNPSYKTYKYADIKKLTVWRYKSIGRGIGYGALIGGGIGALIGLVSYKKHTVGFFNGGFDLGPGVSALGGALAGGLSGILIGTIIGSAKLKFKINRNKAQFNDMRNRVLEKAYGHVRDSTSNQFVPVGIDK